ncbi:unnamed protein product [Malus baccata var. baccata]
MTITSLDLSFLNSRSSLVFTPLLAALSRCSRAFYFPELFYFLGNQTDGFGRKLLIEASYGTLNFTCKFNLIQEFRRKAWKWIYSVAAIQ